MKCKIEVNGKEYLSIAEFCEEFGLNRQKVYAMARRGVPFEDMIPGKEPPLQNLDPSDERVVITAQGKGFASILDFCKFYGLRYTTVIKHARAGETGDQILDYMETRPRRPKPEPVLEFEGIAYSSLADAADSLGISAWRAYAERSATGLDDAEILRRLMKENGAGDAHRKGCVVAGKSYKSRAEAVKEYGVSLSTVTTRMMRDGVTFEEALLQWHVDRQRVFVRRSRAAGFDPRGAVEMEPSGRLSRQVDEILKNNTYSPKFFSAGPNGEEWFCRFTAAADRKHQDIEVYVLGADSPHQDGLEFVIPRLWTFKNPALKAAALEAINELNAQYAGAGFWLKKNTVVATAYHSILSNAVIDRLFLRCLYRLLGSSVKALNVLELLERSAEREKP